MSEAIRENDTAGADASKVIRLPIPIKQVKFKINSEGLHEETGEKVNCLKIDRGLSFTKLLPKVDFFNPVQSLFIGHYKKGSAIVASTTGTGKTICPHFALKDVANFVYVVPTKSLANQIANDFRQYRQVNIKTGDTNTRVSGMRAGGVVTTIDSFVAAARNRVWWVEDAEMIVLDEGHFLLDEFKEKSLLLEEATGFCLSKGVPVIFLSATIPGINDLAKWLKPSVVIESKWRPILLDRKFVVYEDDEEQFETVLRLVRARPDKKIILVPHNKTTGWSWLRGLEGKGYMALNKTVPSSWAAKRKKTNGPFMCAFHNADVPQDEREAIEISYRSANGIRILIATSTLAYGFNSPADTVILCPRSKRVQTGNGRNDYSFEPSPINMLQFEGRAGRCGFSTTNSAESIIVIKSAAREYIENALNSCLDREFDTSLGKDINSLSVNTTAYMLLGALMMSKGDTTCAFKHMESYFRGYAFKGTGLLEKSLDFLKKEELLCRNNSPTYEGRIVASNCVHPHVYLGVKHALGDYTKGSHRYKSLIPKIRPLLRAQFKIEDDLLGKEERELLSKFRGHCVEFLNMKEEDDAINLLFYCMGGFGRPGMRAPSHFETLPTNAVRLGGFLTELAIKGYLPIEPLEAIRLSHSIAYGIIPRYSLLGGVKGIGMISGWILSKIGKAMGLPDDHSLCKAVMTREGKKAALEAARGLEGMGIRIKDARAAIEKLINHTGVLAGNRWIMKNVSKAVFGARVTDSEEGVLEMLV
ncbi:MAG: DEAD/DEAH box helicase [Deltaproteobacteria bacterium]|nr:DEAD/DEAH box helicase [Deltaproteobacteria bacterium]